MDTPGQALTRTHQAIARNLAAAVSQFHRRTPGAVLDAAPDLVFADSGIADPTFNAVVFTRPDPSGLAERIERAVTRMAQTGRPFTWWADPEAPPGGLGRRLLAAGLTQAETLPLMALRLTPPPGHTRSGRSDLVIREVRTETQWADFVAVLLSVWDPPLPAMRDFLLRARSSALASGMPGRFLVGYLDAAPVCTAEVLLEARIAGLYNIVTLPEYQRRGYGTAITVAALELARAAGYRLAALQASAQGEPVYRRLGFEQVGRYEVYALGG
jgi:ribosomal protein S18 acetylase RimI-like enzyme